jgi:hypothetical protein
VHNLGPILRFFFIFSQTFGKKLAKNGEKWQKIGVFEQISASFCNLDQTLVFKKNANYCAEKTETLKF